MKPGVELLEDVPGVGAPVEKKLFYDFRLRMWLSRGEPVRWSEPWALYEGARIEDDGTTLFTSLGVDRVYMFAGLFYGVEGMRVGGTRRIRVAPHLAYREAGLPGVIPPHALRASLFSPACWRSRQSTSGRERFHSSVPHHRFGVGGDKECDQLLSCFLASGAADKNG